MRNKRHLRRNFAWSEPPSPWSKLLAGLWLGALEDTPQCPGVAVDSTLLLGGGGRAEMKASFFRTGATTPHSKDRFGGGVVRDQTSGRVFCLGANAFRRLLHVNILQTRAHLDAQRLRRLFFFRTHRYGRTPHVTQRTEGAPKDRQSRTCARAGAGGLLYPASQRPVTK